MTIQWSDRSTTYTEISLHGQIPPGRHDQLIKILAGVTAMAPTRIIERHQIYTPMRASVQQKAQVGGSQGVPDAAKRAMNKARGETGDLFYLRLVEKIAEGQNHGENHNDDHLKGNKDGIRNIDESKEASGMKILGANDSSWSLRLYGLPEAGKRTATVRNITTEEFSYKDDLPLLEKAGYSFASEFMIEGYQFVQNNTIFLLQKVLRCPTQIIGDAFEKLKKPLDSMPMISSCTPIDASGAYVLEATVRVQDGRHLDSMTRGTQELLGFKERMKGVVDLKVVDRLALDTRVK